MEEGTRENVDSILHKAGDFGRYQILLMVLFSVINVFSSFHYFGQTFISVVPEHQCNVSKERYDHLVQVTKCSKIFQRNGTLIEQPCTEGWIFNNTYGYTSIIEELEWVCRDDWKPTIGQSVFFIGSMAGTLVFGVLADKIGRLHVLILANMCVFIGNITTILSQNATIFGISRFIAGCATDSNFVMMYIIVMEYIRPSMRTFGLNLCIGIFYCLGCMAVPWVAVYLKIWWKFLLVISVPHLTILGFYFIVPESAQWLISKGKTKRAIKCFKRIAEYNGKTISDKAIESLKLYCTEHVKQDEKNDNLLGLLKTPKLRKKTIILIFKSMVMTLGYDTISRNINGLDFSPFMVFTITSSTILPAAIFILLVQDRVGRKALASGALLTSGAFCAISGLFQALLESSSASLIIGFALFSRLAINVAYNSGAQYAVELIPTVVRGQGVSAIHVTGFAASFFCPQILYLGNIWKPFPDIILAILLMLGAFACLFLPETLNKTLPVTLQDGEDFGEDEGICYFSCFKKTPTESTTQLATDDFVTNPTYSSTLSIKQ